MSTLLNIHSIPMELVRKSVKNLSIRILPPDGHVRITAPFFMPNADIQAFIQSKLAWIREKQDLMAKRPRTSQIEMIDGEFHLLWGRSLPLYVVDSKEKNKLVLSDKGLSMFVMPQASMEHKKQLMSQFYFSQLKDELSSLIPTWQNTMGVAAYSWGVKAMKTRWGSCNIVAKRIWLNLELAKFPRECLEYVVVHELAHLHEASHNDRFKALMDQFLPDWRARKALLNHDGS